jgi:hypothetical protein
MRKAAAMEKTGQSDRTGEVHVYGDDSTTIEGSIIIDGRGQYPQAVR